MLMALYMQDCHRALIIGIKFITFLPHGRLIDADELMEKVQETCCFRGDYALLLNDVVEECTTIVPES